MPTTLNTKSDTYTFDLEKFKDDLLEKKTYKNLESIFFLSWHSIRKRLLSETPLRIEEFLEWCSILDLNPIDYITMNEEAIY